MLQKLPLTVANGKMELWLSAFCVASPAATTDLCTQFRRFLFLSLIGILISSNFFSVCALRPQTPTNGDVDNTNRSSVIAENTEVKKQIVGEITRLDHRRHQRPYERFHDPSGNVTSGLQRKQQQEQKKGSKISSHHVNLRKLSSSFGCHTNPSMCLTVPGWTPTSNASTCCRDGFCTDIKFDGFNCGACGNPCAFGYFCCSGECVSTSSDPQNCGECGNVCKRQICDFGFCGY